jgi:hypothetical protein
MDIGDSMENTSFIDFCNDDYISKMNIDPRLVDALKNVLKKIQVYFNNNGYSNIENYQEYLMNYLVLDSEYKLNIGIEELNTSIGGYYNFYNRQLSINSDVINNHPEELEHVLCHEFIHFLVHHSIDLMYGDRWVGEDFIDEGYTELLAREICPSNGIYYGPIPNLLDFYNKVTGTKNNFQMFLSHQLPDLMIKSHYPHMFTMHGSKALNNYENGEYYGNMWQQDSEYLETQRSIINDRLEVDINSFDDLKNLITLLNCRPALDGEWITSYIVDKCGTLISSYDNEEEATNLIVEYINLYNSLKKYDGKDICEIIVGSHILVCDGETISGIDDDIEYYYTYSNGKQILRFHDKEGNTTDFDYINVDVTERNKVIYNRIEEIEQVLSSQKTI